MKKLMISSTANTPLVHFDPQKGIFKIEGRSIPENPGEFFEVIVKWLVEYFKEPVSSSIFKINLEYVNSGSSKYLLDVFRVLKDAHHQNLDVKVHWFYEEDDESIETLGEHYKSILTFPFELIQYY